MAGSIPAGLLAAAVAYVLGKGYVWVVDRIANGRSPEDVKAQMEKAKQRLKTDPHFAAVVRQKARAKQLRKEDYDYLYEDMDHVDQDKLPVPEIGLDMTRERFKDMTPRTRWG